MRSIPRHCAPGIASGRMDASPPRQHSIRKSQFGDHPTPRPQGCNGLKKHHGDVSIQKRNGTLEGTGSGTAHCHPPHPPTPVALGQRGWSVCHHQVDVLMFLHFSPFAQRVLNASNFPSEVSISTPTSPPPPKLYREERKMRGAMAGEAHGGTHSPERKRAMGWRRGSVVPLTSPWLGWGCPHGMEEARMEGAALIWGSLHGQQEPQGHGHHTGQELGTKQLEWRDGQAWGFVLFL